MRKRTRKRRYHLKLAPLLWLSLAANVALGLLYSPITSLTKIRVVGAPLSDRERFAEHLNALANEPYSRISPLEIESHVLANPEIARADFSSNLFGRAVLKVSVRNPVARIGKGGTVVLGSDGVIFRTPAPAPGLPVLQLPREAFAPNLSLFAPWTPVLLAKVAEEFRQSLPAGNWRIEVDSRGAICFNRGVGGRILLGDTNAIGDKLKTLRKILGANPKILDRVKELNLTAPDSPVAVPRDSR